MCGGRNGDIYIALDSKEQLGPNLSTKVVFFIFALRVFKNM